ncbi:unnamed protein product [Cuscuta europaea]|uniref:Uncharacterized protein n=1 Tax=Cuscuta europaea TaxID=41803 RepID=A0A9P1EEI1_CUSEU|nr:unnamed protein product [Cuscuta europaea]
MEEYFRLKATGEKNKVEVAAEAMEDDAFYWFQGWEFRTRGKSWEVLKEDINRCFQQRSQKSEDQESRSSRNSHSSQSRFSSSQSRISSSSPTALPGSQASGRADVLSSPAPSHTASHRSQSSTFTYHSSSQGFPEATSPNPSDLRQTDTYASIFSSSQSPVSSLSDSLSSQVSSPAGFHSSSSIGVSHLAPDSSASKTFELVSSGKESQGTTPTTLNIELKPVAASVTESDPEEDINQPTGFSSDTREGFTGRGLEVLMDKMYCHSSHITRRTLNNLDSLRIDGFTSMMYNQNGLRGGITRNFKEYVEYVTEVEADVNLLLVNDLNLNLLPYAIISGEEVRGLPAVCLSVPEEMIGFHYPTQMTIAVKRIQALHKRDMEEKKGVNDLSRGNFLEAIIIGEDVRRMPAVHVPVQNRGVCFDYRFHMEIAAHQLKILRKRREDWHLSDTLTNSRWMGKCVIDAEDHDQTLMGEGVLLLFQGVLPKQGVMKELHNSAIKKSVFNHSEVKAGMTIMGCNLILSVNWDSSDSGLRGDDELDLCNVDRKFHAIKELDAAIYFKNHGGVFRPISDYLMCRISVDPDPTIQAAVNGLEAEAKCQPYKMVLCSNDPEENCSVEKYIQIREKINGKQGWKMASSLSGEGKAYQQQKTFWKLYMIGKDWKEEEVERYGEKFASSAVLVSEEKNNEELQKSTETFAAVECLKVTEVNETSLKISSAIERSMILKDLVLKSLLVHQPVKYWEGRGARMKCKWKIMADSYHPP